MTSHRRPGSEFETPRWKAVGLGLRLANDHRGLLALGLFYGLWAVLGLVLCFVLIPFAIWGKEEAFKNALNPVALYGFMLPSALLCLAIWGVQLSSRLLWCCIPEPLTAALFAGASVAGRLSVLGGAICLWTWGRPYGEGLLRPEVIGCSGIAWLGLLSDWTFVRTLRREFLPEADSAGPSAQSELVMENPTEQRRLEPTKETVFRRHYDPGAWFKSRFPRAHTFVVWILLPIAYVAGSALADNGELQAIPKAILRLGIIGPAILQIFWIPNQARLTKPWSTASLIG